MLNFLNSKCKRFVSDPDSQFRPDVPAVRVRSLIFSLWPPFRCYLFKLHSTQASPLSS